MATKAERELSRYYGKGMEALYRQAAAIVRAGRRGELPEEIPGELPIAMPVQFICSTLACAGETLTLAVRRRDPVPPCPRCGGQLARGAWQRRGRGVRRARGVNLLALMEARRSDSTAATASVSSGGDSQNVVTTIS